MAQWMFLHLPFSSFYSKFQISICNMPAYMDIFYIFNNLTFFIHLYIIKKIWVKFNEIYNAILTLKTFDEVSYKFTNKLRILEFIDSNAWTIHTNNLILLGCCLADSKFTISIVYVRLIIHNMYISDCLGVWKNC